MVEKETNELFVMPQGDTLPPDDIKMVSEEESEAALKDGTEKQ